MTIGAGFLYGLGVFSGLVLAGIGILIYLALKPFDIEIPDDDPETVARINAAAARVTASRGKVEDASQVARTTEPGEPNAP